MSAVDELDLTCQRCNDEKGGTTGYIFWDDATDEEKAAVPEGPDGDDEISCPDCGGSGELPEEVASKLIAEAKERERQRELAEKAPPAKFTLTWTDDATATVNATTEVGSKPRTVKIGLLSYQGNGWSFIKVTPDGSEVTDGVVHIPVSEATETHLRQMEEESRITAKSDAVLKGHLKAIETMRNQYRDDSREEAEVGVHIPARKWWREFCHL